MSLAMDIADAVAAELNAAEAGTFSQAFTAERRVLPTFELSELAELKVTVVPKAVEITGSTRSASQYDIAVDIAVQRKVSKDLESDAAELATLVDEIADYLRQRPLTDASHASWVKIVNEPIYAPEHLAEQRLFTSLLTVTYRAMT